MASTREKKKLSRVRRMESAGETAVIFKIVKAPWWEGGIRWGSPSFEYLREECRSNRGRCKCHCSAWGRDMPGLCEEQQWGQCGPKGERKESQRRGEFRERKRVVGADRSSIHFCVCQKPTKELKKKQKKLQKNPEPKIVEVFCRWTAGKWLWCISLWKLKEIWVHLAYYRW